LIASNARWIKRNVPSLDSIGVFTLLVVVPAFLMIRLLKPGFVLPAFSILLFSDAAITAILARAIHARGNSENVTLWDIAGTHHGGLRSGDFQRAGSSAAVFRQPVEQHPDTSL
jgi:hypothetical protein